MISYCIFCIFSYDSYIVFISIYQNVIHKWDQWRSQGWGGQPGICPPPLGLRQALGRECTHQADQGEMVIYNNREDKIQILLGYLY